MLDQAICSYSKDIGPCSQPAFLHYALSSAGNVTTHSSRVPVAHPLSSVRPMGGGGDDDPQGGAVLRCRIRDPAADLGVDCVRLVLWRQEWRRPPFR
jgi:hypothetical protein